MNYFTIQELVYSDTAIKKKIDNTPNAVEVKHLEELIAFLNPIREAWGSPIKVTSGYRCDALNKAVGGVYNSSHRLAYAVDIQPTKGTVKELFCFIKGYLIGSKIPFGQLIMEHSGSKTWVHLSCRDISGQRCQVKELYV